jgi:hypothetical protein
MRSTSRVFFAAFLGLAGLSCGSDSGSETSGATCGGDTCGGPVEGSWKLSDACFNVLEQPKLEGCPDAVADLVVQTSDGNITFRDDVYERHIEVLTKLVLKLPASCKEDRECSEIGTRLASAGATLTCEDGDGDGCECSASLTSTFNDSGAYKIRGNRVEIVGDTLEYCVQGDTLSMRPSLETKMSGSAVTSILQTTFQKN